MSMTVTNTSQAQLSKTMMKLSTMKRINSAADDAAGLAIAEKITSQLEGLDKGSQNTMDMNNLVNTAEGSLSTVNDSLQRIRELTVQSQNGVYSDSDRAIMQEEVSQLMNGIESMVNSAQFNNKQLLDGSFSYQNTASGPDGTGVNVSIPNMSVNALGISSFNLTDPANSDIFTIDTAIAKVNTTRAELGALSNTMQSTVAANDITNITLAAARSRIADLDVAKGVMDYNKNKVLEEYQMFAMIRQNEDTQRKVGILF